MPTVPLFVAPCGQPTSGIGNAIIGGLATLVAVIGMATAGEASGIGTIFSIFNFGPQTAGFVFGLFGALLSLGLAGFEYMKWKAGEGSLESELCKKLAAGYFVALVFACFGFLWFVPLLEIMGYKIGLGWHWSSSVLLGGVINIFFACLQCYQLFKMPDDKSAAV